MPSRVVHCRKEPYDVYIGRGKCPNTGIKSIWGNPYSHLPNTLALYRTETRQEAIEKYEAYVRSTPELIASLSLLRGKVLGCWCHPAPCHGNVLIRLSEEFFGLGSHFI